MKLLFALSVMVLCFVGCNDPTGPTPASPAPRQSIQLSPFIPGTVLAVYSVTFTASGTCAENLPSIARTRSYVATFRDDGTLHWTGPTLPPGSEYLIESHASRVDDRFHFSVGVDDPLADDYGIWDNISAAEVLTIKGKGEGRVDGGTLSGNFSGLLAFYTVGTTGTLQHAGTCRADDHLVTLIEQ